MHLAQVHNKRGDKWGVGLLDPLQCRLCSSEIAELLNCGYLRSWLKYRLGVWRRQGNARVRHTSKGSTRLLGGSAEGARVALVGPPKGTIEAALIALAAWVFIPAVVAVFAPAALVVAADSHVVNISPCRRSTIVELGCLKKSMGLLVKAGHCLCSYIKW